MAFDSADTTPAAPSHVVGIGASAGGLEALQTLFEALPVDTGMAFVVVQHLSPNFKSLMPELLERHTRMPVVALTHDQRLAADHVYVLTAGLGVTVQGESLHVAPRDARNTQHMPINRFFESLSPLGARAACVVLSGTGTDGTEGARAVRAAQGLVIAQKPASARFDSMPTSAIESGCVDVAVDPDDIPAALAAWAADPVGGRHFATGTEPAPAGAVGPLAPILDLLRKTYEIDFDQYKPATIVRRVERFIQNGPAPATVEATAARLAANPAELDRLFSEILIGVTRFLRDPEAFEALRTASIEPLVAALGANEELRVWACGCSTGEEAYSIGMLALDAFAREGRAPRLRILATDVHGPSLHVASSGLYTDDSLASVPLELRRRYFIEQPTGLYKVCDELRRAVIFSAHNVLRDAPFTRIDVVACRNLMIYFQPAAQLRALAAFHSALRGSGALFLGESEGPGDLEVAFEPLRRGARLFRKRPGIQLPVEVRSALAPMSTNRAMAMSLDTRAAQRLNEALLQRYVPAGLLVNHQQMLLHVYGDAGRYLRTVAGQFKGELWSLLAPTLRTAAGMALRKAEQTRASVSFGDIAFVDGSGQPERIRLTVDPVLDPRLPQPFFMVRFLPQLEVPRAAGEGAEVENDPRVALQVEELEAELHRAREALQHTVEELEAANEELQAGNEELMASNEELQSTNEELHAVNEELYSVNSEHEQKIQELRATTADLNNLIRAIDVAILFLDRDVRLRLFTPAATQIFPLQPTDIGRDLRDFMPKEHDATLVDDIDGALAHAQPVDRELALADGRFLRRRLAPYRDDGGHPSGLVLTYVDVTPLVRLREEIARARIEAELRDHERFLQQVADSTPVQVAYWDRAQRLHFANTAFCSGVEQERAALIGQDRRTLLGAALHEAEQPHLQAVLLGQRVRFERTRTLAGQGVRHELVDFVPDVVDGEVRGFFASAADVTAIREAGIALEALFSANPAAVLLVSAEGRVLKWNEAASELLLRDADRLGGLPVEDLVPPNLRTRHQELRLDYQTQPTRRAMLQQRLVPVLRGDGSVAEIDIRLGPIRWQGKSATIVSMAAPPRLQAPEGTDDPASRARRNFLANMSHEMRTPLNAIVGMAQLMKLEAPSERQVDRLRRIEDASEHLLGIVDDVLDFARIDSGSLTLQVQEFAPAEVLERAVALLAERARLKHLALRTEPAPDLPARVRGDARRIEQVLVNLIGNAVKFTPAGHIRVRLAAQPGRAPGSTLRFEVEDTGIGIPAEHQARLFRPFQQVEDHTARRFGGTGLGLAISRELARAMGGDCGVSSVPGHGSTFWFTAQVEAVERPREPRRRVAAEAPDLRALCAGRRVLIVEDEPVNRVVLGQLLRGMAGIEPAEAVDGAEAIEMVRAGEFDLVLMDMQLPGVDGEEATRRIRALGDAYSTLPIVALTANVFPEDIARCRAAGMNGHLGKPISLSALSAVLTEWLVPGGSGRGERI